MKIYEINKTVKKVKKTEKTRWNYVRNLLKLYTKCAEIEYKMRR